MSVNRIMTNPEVRVRSDVLLRVPDVAKRLVSREVVRDPFWSGVVHSADRTLGGAPLMQEPLRRTAPQDRIGVSWHLTSDTHFSHANIIRYCDRPFSDLAVMNERLVDAWNDRVRPDDEIWHLGDVALGRIEESLLIIRRLHGRKFLVPGNHDRCWPGHKKVGDWPEKYTAAGFTLLPRTTTLTLASREVLLCHFPYRGDSGEMDRYRDERPADEGRWLLHGHVHDRWRQL